MHYTHLTKIKAHHIHPQSYMQTLNLRGKKKNDQEENKGKYFMKIPHTHTHTHTHIHTHKSKTLQEQGRENNNTHSIHFVSSCLTLERSHKGVN